MKKEIIIFGNGNHCKIVKQEISKISFYKIAAIFDFKSNKISLNKDYRKKKINFKKSISAITAVGDNLLRKELVNIVNKKFKKVYWEKIISKDAIINKNVIIKEGSLVVSGAVINAKVNIGSHSIINTSCSIDHDVKIGNFSTISPGVNIAGNVWIGNKVFIGIGASIIPKIKIKDNVTVGGMSFVNKNCEIGKTYFGVPAKKIK